MPDPQQDLANDPGGTAGTGPGASRTVEVIFKFAEASELVTGQRITGFPSYVVGSAPILIDPLPAGLDRTSLQAAINRRASDLATVAQALGLASSQLADAIVELDKAAG